ncbi:hypothetical protein BDV41DRAFT_536510 [Aspergillus transmontanensis]|uniref:Uncharacterized protein n=1 Tax=Aspergillus transmontanensis TaxID=1034304 RepID=A0A5N6VYJ7_9EURO|nr:hypothetical protein BDV41DRAFT_536510 [Aspergillus transmontanensis]
MAAKGDICPTRIRPLSFSSEEERDCVYLGQTRRVLRIGCYASLSTCIWFIFQPRYTNQCF